MPNFVSNYFDAWQPIRWTGITVTEFKANYLKTKEEKDEVSRRFDQLYVRPDTSDYQWLDDCDKRQSRIKTQGVQFSITP